MELLKVFALLVLILMALVHSSIASSPLLEEEEDDLDVSGDDQEDFGDDFVLRSSDDSHGRFMLGRKNSLVLTCNKFPRICLLNGGPRRHCCQKKCVNLLGDRLNCGKCGRKCKYGYICCRGKCVNPSVSKKHCGGCNQGCNSGGFCAFGLCNYA
ncbi:hypothetical protein PVL29_025707 [Vitis rotundifolia]|uniref:Stigma-specific STIG1-like protein 1 n=1 Tax=Vitis rotundifolia TaxID=103349 RepID=A0AA38YKL5_VITRO|nr:hypothetical protein PVL29_025707 [Vitis rotundifolia]